MKRKTLLLLGLVFILNCGTEQTVTLAPDPAVDSDVEFITLRAIDDEGKSQIEIPLSVFGESSEALTNSTIDIEVNGLVRNTGLMASDYYTDVVERVAFYMYGLNDGDEVLFAITLNNSSLATDESETESTDSGIVATDDTPSTLSINAFTTEGTEDADLFFRGTFSVAEDTAALIEVLDTTDETASDATGEADGSVSITEII